MVDSMQVYREIPLITNQLRGRPAELAGIVSVAEDWTVASHKQRAEAIISSLPAEVPFVLDSGTGMYLNAILLGIPLAPKVSPEIRARAERIAAGADNPRRAAREIELNIAGARERGSIWSGEPRYGTALVYIRPQGLDLDHNIRARSSRIAREGQQEAKALAASDIFPNPSVREAIGVKEMLLHVSGYLSREEAEQTVATRTRKLARRQIRWFDKLVRSLPQETRTLIVEDAKDLNIKHIMHDIIEA